MTVEFHAEVAASLLDSGATLERLADSLGFVEGPVWHPDGYLLFTDIGNNAILRWDEHDGITVWRQPSGHANGLALRPDGTLVVCEHDRSVVLAIRPSGGEEILASHFDGRELNSPNDVALHADGAVYFTDPHPAGRTADWGVERPQQLDFNGVYRIPAAGGLELVARDATFPNGVCVSPDGSTVYYNDSIEMSITAVALGAGGALGERRTLIVQGEAGRIEGGSIVPAQADRVGFPDGMRCDEHGNVWCTGPGGIWIIAPGGEHLATIETPEFAANLAWGGPDWRQLFVTASTGLYRLQTHVTGVRPL